MIADNAVAPAPQTITVLLHFRELVQCHFESKHAAAIFHYTADGHTSTILSETPNGRRTRVVCQ